MVFVEKFCEIEDMNMNIGNNQRQSSMKLTVFDNNHFFNIKDAMQKKLR